MSDTYYTVAGVTSGQPAPLTWHQKMTPDMLLRKMLRDIKEPTAVDPNQFQTCLDLNSQIKSKLKQLLDYRARNWPNCTPKLETTIAELYFKRYYFFVWRAFPINDLPDEILLKIFHYAAWSPRELHMTSIDRLRLTWVCRRWRSVAINDMTLWSSISFRDPPPYTCSLAFLERAGSAPLDLRINEKNDKWLEEHKSDVDPSSEDTHPYTPAMMGDLMDHILRKIRFVRTLIVVVDTWPPALMVLAKLRSSEVVLESLERFELHRASRPWLWIGPRYEPEDLRAPITFFNGKIPPKLRHLSLSGVNVDWENTSLANLTVFDIRQLALQSAPRLYKFRELLMSSLNLTKLSLQGAGPMWSQEDRDLLEGSPPIHLPNLAMLVLGNFSSAYVLYCLKNFRAPNVMDLTLLNLFGSDYGPLFEVLTSRFPEVQVLTMYTVEVDDTITNKRRLINWLKSMPKISCLKVAQLKKHILRAFIEDPRQWDGSVVDILAPKADALPVCQKLAIVEYHHLPTELVVMFLEGRSNRNAPLKRLYVVSAWFQAMKPDDRNTLASLVPVYQCLQAVLSAEELLIRQTWCAAMGVPFAHLP